MADNLTTTTTVSTIPSGTVISTDDAGAAGHVQRVKLAIAADGSATSVPSDATDGLLVNLGANNDVTVTSGTVTANLSATDNAVLDNIQSAVDAIQTAVELIDNAISGTEMQVDVVTSALPTGAATAANQATANTALSAIQTALELIDNAISGTEMQVDIVASLPAGTNAIGKLAANDGVDIGDVTINNSSLTVDAANDGTLVVTLGDGTNTATVRNLAANDALNVAIVDGAGNQVTSFGGSGGTSATDDSAFTAGSGSGTPIMGLASADTVDSGDVGVLGMDTSRNLKVSIEADNVGIGGGTQYTEDDAAAANPVGNMLMGVRDDALSGQTSTDGDNIAARMTDNGELYVKHADTLTVDGSGVTQPVSGTVTANLGATDNAVLDSIDAAVNGTLTVGSHAVTNAGTFAVQEDGAALTALQLIDDIILADDAAFTPGTTKVAMAGFEFDDTTPDSVDEGDAGAARMSANRNIYTQLRDAAGNERGVNVTAANALEVDGSGVTQPVSGTVTANLSATDNAVLDSIQAAVETIDNAISGSEMQVDVVASLPAGTNAIGKLAANSGVDIGDVDVLSLPGVAGDVAHDSADSGNPLKVGGKAKNFDGSAPGTAVAEDDRVDFIADVEGRQYVETTHPNYWTVSADYAAAQTDTTIKAAPGAGLRLYLTDVIVSNGATAGNITLLDGAGGTVLLELYPAINGGMAMPFRTPIPLTANTLLAITSTTVTTHSVTINGYIAP